MEDILNIFKQNKNKIKEEKGNTEKLISKIFIENKISCKLKEKQENVCSEIYKYVLLDYTIPFSKIQKISEIITIFIGSDVIIENDENEEGFLVKITKKDRKIKNFIKEIGMMRKEQLKKGTPKSDFCTIGETENNEFLDFYMNETPHILISGGTGSGKTTCLHTIICNLIMDSMFFNSNRFIMIDLKKTELSVYDDLTTFMVMKTVTDRQEAELALRNMLIYIDKIYEKLQDDGSSNIEEYNKKNDLKIISLYVVIDELAELVMVNKKVETLLIRISQIGRAAGVHLILATQRPSREVINGLLKINIPTRICFKVPDTINSKIVLDEEGAEKLLGKGDGYFKGERYNKKIRFQNYHITRNEIKELIKMTLEIKKKGTLEDGNKEALL